MKRLHLISYLAPSIPADFFRLIAGDLDASLEFNAVWAYNDRNSRSGWFSMLDRVGKSFFAQTMHSGSHLRSIEMVNP